MARHRHHLLLVEGGAPQRDGHRCTLNHVASGGGDEARAYGLAGRDLDHPGGTLLVATLARPDHATAHEVLDELPDDVAMRAEDDIIELRVAHELERAGQAAPLRQRRGLLDLESAILRKRLHRLHTAQIRAGVDRRGVERLEDIDQVLRLLDTFLAQRTEAVVPLPVAATAGLGVADEVYSAQGTIHSRSDFRSRAFHTFGQSLRASFAARCSIGISCPGTNARRPA